MNRARQYGVRGTTLFLTRSAPTRGAAGIRVKFVKYLYNPLILNSSEKIHNLGSSSALASAVRSFHYRCCNPWYAKLLASGCRLASHFATMAFRIKPGEQVIHGLNPHRFDLHRLMALPKHALELLGRRTGQRVVRHAYKRRFLIRCFILPPLTSLIFGVTASARRYLETGPPPQYSPVPCRRGASLLAV